MTDHLEAAMEEGGDVIYEKLFAYGLNGTDAREAAEAAITAALPHLRKALFQELIKEADNDETVLGIVGIADYAKTWLRAKLKEAEQ